MKMYILTGFFLCLTVEPKSVSNSPVQFDNAAGVKTISLVKATKPPSGSVNRPQISQGGSIIFPTNPKVVTSQVIKPGGPTPTKPGGLFPTNSAPDFGCIIQSGMAIFQGECHRLLSPDSPCGDNKWLVINSKGIPECANKKCPFGQLFFKDKCVNVASNSTCGISEILYVEFSGEVYCDCEPDFLFDENSNHCQAEHSRGSCSFGEYLEATNDNKVACVANPCKRDDLIFNIANKKCYKKTYIGKCSKEKGLGLLFQDDNTATCLSIVNRNIFEVPALSSCPAGSKRDNLGHCQAVLRFDPASPSSYRVPSYHSSSFSACPHSYTRYPNGACRKVNPFLGE